ncbi:MAG: NifU family protein [Alphaproteobacteria bacterium]|nr:NifU family protein [Alphaproteobacteria bacterium]
MFIQTEPTPNPATLKFLPGRSVMARGTADFPVADKAQASPLAVRLFGVDGVRGVFLGSDFISVTKDDSLDWNGLKPMVLGAIVEHYLSGEPVVIESQLDAIIGGEDNDLVARIKELLDTRVRPAVANDGGDIIFRDFTDGVVYLKMQGACSGCPSSTATLRHGIENMLKHYIPEVIAVRAVS